MKKRGFIIAGVLGVIAALVANLPLFWVAGMASPTPPPENVKFGGTVWNSHISGLPGIGPVSLKSSPLSAITGKPFIHFKTQSPVLFAEGTARFGEIRDVSMRGNFGQLAQMDGRFAGLVGNFTLTLQSLSFSDVCEAASGTVATDVLSQNQARLQWTGPRLSGPVSCENGDLVLNLTGNDSQQSIESIIRVSANGTYRANINVLSRDDRAGAVLPLYGFEVRNGEYSLVETGRWD